MDRCHYLTVDGQDVICTAVDPPVILGDIMGYSGFACSVCKRKINESTLDEAPFAYKDYQEIMECVEPTVEIVDRFIPIFNFKAN